MLTRRAAWTLAGLAAGAALAAVVPPDPAVDRSHLAKSAVLELRTQASLPAFVSPRSGASATCSPDRTAPPSVRQVTTGRA